MVKSSFEFLQINLKRVKRVLFVVSFISKKTGNILKKLKCFVNETLEKLAKRTWKISKET